MTSEQDRQAYAECMEQVKRRLSVIDRLVTGQSGTGDESSDSEYACLQLRKTLELIAFASMAANKEVYSRFQENLAKEWRAKKILERLHSVNAEFYPIPLRLESTVDRHHTYAKIEQGFLTQEDFVELYNKCSEAIHEWNPFRTDDRVLNLSRSVHEWSNRIRLLLDLHLVRLVDQQDVLLVKLGNSAIEKCQVWPAAPMNSREHR